MTYLLLAILSSAGVSLVMRLGVDRVKNNITMLAAGYLSCTLLALLHTAVGGPITLTGEGMPTTVLLGIIAGVLLLAGFVFLQLNVRVNGVVLSGIFAKLGVLVPTAISVLCFGERPRMLQLTGFILAILAILLIHSDQESGKAGSKVALIFLLLSNGGADAMSKIYEEVGNGDLQELYLLLSFFAAFLLCILLVLHQKQSVAWADLGFGMLLGIPNYYSARFLIKALGSVPAVVATLYVG